MFIFTGIAGLEFKLASDTVLGTWSIIVTPHENGAEEITTFKVKKYGKFSYHHSCKEKPLFMGE